MTRPKVELGGTTLVAHLTPGHTKGCTTWTMDVKDGGKILHVVIVGSPNVNAGYKLRITSNTRKSLQITKGGFAFFTRCPATFSSARTALISTWTKS